MDDKRRITYLALDMLTYSNSEFTAYHRLYDVLNLTVISDKDTVGFFDMNSKVVVEKVED